MAGDDHPDKKVVADGQKGKNKEKEVKESTEENKSASDDSTSINSEVPPVKKPKVDDAGTSSAVLPQPVPVLQQSALPLQVPCPLCNRIFDSYPAMFGHQRVHKERTYRGAYPPPAFRKEGSVSSVMAEETEAARNAAQMLIDMSHGLFEIRHTILNSADQIPAAVDPNASLEEGKTTDEDEEQEKRKEKFQLDLNKSPPRSE